MAKKDELLENKNNKSEENSETISLETMDVEELQDDFSSIFNQDYDEPEDTKWEDVKVESPLALFLTGKGRYGKKLDFDDEKSSKKKLPWRKKTKKRT